MIIFKVLKKLLNIYILIDGIRNEELRYKTDAMVWRKATLKT